MADNHCEERPRPAPARTLLPSPIASIVSLATRSSSIYLRVGTFIGGLAIDGARITTLTGLEIGRSVIEGILLRAGGDVAAIRSDSEMGKAEAESLIERSIVYLHSTFTSASFIASTGFGVSSAVLTSASSLSMHMLYALDSILGSTESSRAIASIITLIRREFRNPETGAQCERVGIVDLLIGTSGLALVQKWCRKRTEKLVREGRTEEAVWDVVVLDNGRRADVVAGGDGSLWKKQRPASFVSTTGGQEVIQAIERVGDYSSESGSSIESTDQTVGDTWPEKDFPQRITEKLPPNAKVSVTTSIKTTKTVTVEICGAEPPDMSLPPGAVIIEESSHHGSAMGGETNRDTTLANATPDAYSPRYRVVYQTTQNQSGRTSIGGERDSDSERDGPVDTCGAAGAMPTLRGSLLPVPRNGEGVFGTPKGIQPYHHQTAPRTPPANTRKASRVRSDTWRSKELGLVLGSNTANQKRPRKPVNSSSSHNVSDETERGKGSTRKSPPPKTSYKAKEMPSERAEKMKSIKRAFKKGASNAALGNLWGKDDTPDIAQNPRKGKEQRQPWGSNQGQLSNKLVTGSSLPVPQWQSSLVTNKGLPRVPPRSISNFFTSKDLSQKQEVSRSSSRASYFSIHERRRDSLVSQTDTYSIHSSEKFPPGSPSHLGNHARSSSSLLRVKSAKDITVNALGLTTPSSPKNHQRSKSYAPSIYTLRTNDSETSLVLANPHRKSAFDDHSSIMSLNRSGYVPNLFPRSHFVHNIVRFMRFSSASYGSNFLRLMGIVSQKQVDPADADAIREHQSFGSHTRLPTSTILLSSHFDPQGGSNSTGETDTDVPMVHFVSLDHESRCVVLTCRGTLGFEDVLTDLTCEFDDIVWRHKTYKVHKGMHASARKLLEGGGGKVMATIKVALDEYPEYGLVLCGHSLGAGVTAILAILLSEPDVTGLSGSAFVTVSPPSEAPLLMGSPSPGRQKPTPPSPEIRNYWLPGGRPIHVYAYGPPGTVSSSLRLATRGLITTIVNGQDLVPHLSLGVLHDLQGVALAFKTDTSGAKSEVRRRVWAGLTGGLTGDLFGQPCSCTSSDEHGDDWALSALKSLRVNMLSAKLMPPGEVFVIETSPVLQREAFTPGDPTDGGYPRLGRPATRAVLKLIRDVDGRFGEVRFGGSMLGDHSPWRYEMSLGALGKGVLGDEG
ncbi:MAG: hypothetical protein M1839_006851 [Geoglossum umbratile]|nr:MAG: hypothetical protein M1839_006851 [Geoglossum umbratile]